jgi:hypothetical protein
MHRPALILTAVAACAVVALAGSAAAKSAPKTCTTTSKNVIGSKVSGTLTSSNVDPSQARFATCAQAKKVMNGATGLRIEEPRASPASTACRRC